MKQDLATTVVTAIIGIIAAYFVCSMILPAISSVTYKSLNTELTYDLKEPNPEIFNFRAVNPTVEVYVGQCDSYDEYGNCISETEVSIDPNQNENALEDAELEETTNQSRNNSNGGNSNGSTN